GATLGEGLCFAERQVRVREGQASDGHVHILAETVTALAQDEVNAGLTQHFEVAVEAAHVQCQTTADRLAGLRPAGHESQQAIKTSKTLRGHGGPLRRLGWGRGFAFLGHTVLGVGRRAHHGENRRREGKTGDRDTVPSRTEVVYTGAYAKSSSSPPS